MWNILKLMSILIISIQGVESQDVKFHVVGAGLGRTGTMSLKKALEIMGFGKVFHMEDSGKSPYLEPLWEELAELSPVPSVKKQYGKNNKFRTVPEWPPSFNPKYRANRVKIWSKLLGLDQSYWIEQGQNHSQYNSVVDFPTCIFFRDIFETFDPAKSKVILSRRETGEKWIESALTSILESHSSRRDWGKEILFRISPMRWINSMLWNTLYRFFPSVILDEDYDMLASYHDHWNEHVRETMREYSNLNSIPLDSIFLEFQAKDGWEPLCKFLQVEECPKDPFPHINDKEEFKRRKRFFSMIGYCYGFLVFLIALVAIWFTILILRFVLGDDFKDKQE